MRLSNNLHPKKAISLFRLIFYVLPSGKFAKYLQRKITKDMVTGNMKNAMEIKQKNVIDMGLTFSAMIRLFEKGSKQTIAEKLHKEFQRLDRITTIAEFRSFHLEFCEWFTTNIKTAQRERDNRIIRKSNFALYGHAAKLLDVSLKVYVNYSSLPDAETAETLLPFLNTAIDSPLLKYLKKSFQITDVSARTVEQIDETTYERLQNIIKEDIKNRFNNQILPTQYDDIMWYKLNREN